jgi:hypothetical protein
MYSLLDSAIVGSGENSTAMKNMLLWPIILAPALLFAVPRYGALGAACSWAVCFPVIFVLAVRRIARKLETTAPTLLAPLILPALFAAASAALAYAIEVVAAGHLPILLVCVLQAVAGLATYVLVYRIMSRTAYDEVMDLGRRLLNRGRQAPI